MRYAVTFPNTKARHASQRGLGETFVGNNKPLETKTDSRLDAAANRSSVWRRSVRISGYRAVALGM
jgi:hypothetical protein